MQAAWDAAVADHLHGHGECSFGGMLPATGYWLAAEGCDRNHGETCTWCPAPATTGFCGWADDTAIWQVPACQVHAEAWAAEHPQWAKQDLGPTEGAEYEAAARLADQALADAMIWGINGHSPAKPQMTGLLSTLTTQELDFERAMDRIIREANAGPEYVAVLRNAAEQTGAFSGMAPTDVANAFADLLAAPRLQEEELRRTNQMWSGLFPDVAERGNDSPYVSVRHMHDGDLVWSWVARGQRRWQPGWVQRERR